MTNEEYIKSLSTKQLAAFLCDLIECIDCPGSDHCIRGHKGLEDWLKLQEEK